MVYVAFGAAFGFILSRVGATRFDTIQGMFLLEDLHLMGVIGVAVAVAGVGFALLRRRGIACDEGCGVTLAPKAVKTGNVVGSLLFGVGWALTGTCPGTGLAQLGEGKVIALFTVAGIFGGAALYQAIGPAFEARLDAARRWLPLRRRSTPVAAASGAPAS